MLKLAKEIINEFKVSSNMVLRDDADVAAFRIAIPLPESRKYSKDAFTAVFNFMIHPITKTMTVVLWSDSLINVSKEPQKTQIEGLHTFLKQINCSDYVYIDDDKDVRTRLVVNDVNAGEGKKLCLHLVNQMSKIANVVYSYMHEHSRWL